MQEEISEYTFTLTKPFKYAFKGDQRDAGFVLLTAPTMLQHSQSSALKQSISKIVASAIEGIEDAGDGDEGEDKDVGGVTAKMVINTIYTSTCVDANIVWEQAKALFKQGVALIDGEQKLTDPLLLKMDTQDFENLVGEYVANFILV